MRISRPHAAPEAYPKAGSTPPLAVDPEASTLRGNAETSCFNPEPGTEIFLKKRFELHQKLKKSRERRRGLRHCPQIDANVDSMWVLIQCALGKTEMLISVEGTLLADSDPLVPLHGFLSNNPLHPLRLPPLKLRQYQKRP
ncbi:hypothetical protein chiPu_0008667 [Chiloscyllium punctatum]|uniref:Uncharacterized protein n=1 Tax=Chiloscyllium punctatum TaxID=137246 RepID=A0A401SII1_CHIPU|nr:hypothetical protein [Chiloscyllium punctatum]